MDYLLERLDLVYGVMVCLIALLPVARFRALGALGAALLGLAAAADAVGGPEATGSFATINEALALLGVGIALVAGGLTLRRGTTAPADSAPPGFSEATPPSPPAALLLAGLALAALGPHLLLLGLGAALSLGSAVREVLRARRPGWLAPLLLAALMLGTALALLLTILGPGSATLASLAEGPFSFAAERLLVLLTGGASLLLIGWLPGGRAPWGRSLVPLSAILLVRIVVPALPLGLATLQAPALLLLLGLLAAAAASLRFGDVAIAAGLMTLWTGSRDAIPAATVLVGWGWLVETGTTLAARRGIVLDPRWRGIATLPAALAALPALGAGLATQVLLSVAAVGACAAGCALQGLRGRGAAKAPLY